jgi:hypothetical protein
VKFKLEELINLGYNERFKAKGDNPGDRWYAKVRVTYDLTRGRTETDLIGMDNIYFDFSMKTSKNGEMVKDYGKRWIKVYIPKATVKQFVNKFKDCTGWDVSAKMFTVDDGQGLYSINAKIDEQDPPMVTSVIKVEDVNRNPIGGAWSLNERGSIQTLCADPNYQCIPKGTGFFSISMNVVTVLNSTVAPKASPSNPCRVTFTLLRARLFGLESSIHTVGY